MTWRDAAYKLLAASNDYRAVRRHRVPQRIARRIVGRATGRLMGRIFR